MVDKITNKVDKTIFVLYGAYFPLLELYQDTFLSYIKTKNLDLYRTIW